MSNIQTSQRYKQFMSSIATLKSIRSLEQDNFYRPLLDVNNSDNCGQYAYVWQNPVYQGKFIENKEWDRNLQSILVLFHTSTLMPNTRADHEFKKKLIGNDYVIIVYNESEHPFDMKTLKVSLIGLSSKTSTDFELIQTGVCRYMIEVCPQINSNYTRIRLIRRNHVSASSTFQNIISFVFS